MWDGNSAPISRELFFQPLLTPFDPFSICQRTHAPIYCEIVCTVYQNSTTLWLLLSTQVINKNKNNNITWRTPLIHYLSQFPLLSSLFSISFKFSLIWLFLFCRLKWIMFLFCSLNEWIRDIYAFFLCYLFFFIIKCYTLGSYMYLI